MASRRSGSVVAAAVVPSAPLLVPGASPALPDGVAAVSAAVSAILGSLPAADVAVLVASGAGGLYEADMATLRGIGRPDIERSLQVCRSLVAVTSRETGLARVPGQPLPLALSVLALLCRDALPVVPLAVGAWDSFDALVGVGTGVARAVGDSGLAAVVIAAGDCAAGLTSRAPLALVPGAGEWDDRLFAAVDGRLDGLAGLGPAEARRFKAVGWAPMSVLRGICSAGNLRLRVRHYSAPRGVGYLVASSG